SGRPPFRLYGACRGGRVVRELDYPEVTRCRRRPAALHGALTSPVCGSSLSAIPSRWRAPGAAVRRGTSTTARRTATGARGGTRGLQSGLSARDVLGVGERNPRVPHVSQNGTRLG